MLNEIIAACNAIDEGMKRSSSSSACLAHTQLLTAVILCANFAGVAGNQQVSKIIKRILEKIVYHLEDRPQGEIK